MNEVKLNEVRVRLTMFNGAATLEVDADKMVANCQERDIPKDLLTIRDCLTTYVGAIRRRCRTNRLLDHTLKFMMFAKLLSEPKNNQTFLMSFAPSQLKAVAGGDIHPAVKFEVEDKQTSAFSSFEVMRAYQAQDELFISATLLCLNGCSLTTMEQRMEHLLSFLSNTCSNIGLRMSTPEGCLLNQTVLQVPHSGMWVPCLSNCGSNGRAVCRSLLRRTRDS